MGFTPSPQFRLNPPLDTFPLPQYLMVPKPQYSETGLKESLRPGFICFDLFSMLPTIHFNYKFLFQTYKIKNEVPKRMLTPELATFHLSATQNRPDRQFCIRHCSAKFALYLVSENAFIRLA